MATRRPESFWPVGAPSQATSTGVADVKTFLAPKSAAAFMVSVGTTAARLSVDGSTPSATVGVTVQVTGQPLVLNVAPAGDVRVAAASAGNSVVDVQFLS